MAALSSLSFSVSFLVADHLAGGAVKHEFGGGLAYGGGVSVSGPAEGEKALGQAHDVGDAGLARPQEKDVFLACGELRGSADFLADAVGRATRYHDLGRRRRAFVLLCDLYGVVGVDDRAVHPTRAAAHARPDDGGRLRHQFVHRKALERGRLDWNPAEGQRERSEKVAHDPERCT